jgi:putative SOS response-associated peptidase YedK
MCGRYTLATPLDELVEEFRVTNVALEDIEPRYNVAPGQQAPIIVRGRDPASSRGGGGVRLGQLRWGLVPHWVEDARPRGMHINARSETAARAPAFRDAFKRRRCLVPADGFYEWADDGPSWIHRPDLGVLSFAGLWERWRPRDGGEPLLTFCILTTPANAALAGLHDRMPVVIPAESRDLWLSSDTPSEALNALLRPAPDDLLEVWPVSTLVNSVAFDDPACITPLGEGSH